MDALDDRLGELLQDIAAGLADSALDEEFDDWLKRTRELDSDVDHAWALVRQATESARLNPRRSAGPLRDPGEWVALLERIEQAVAEIRSMLNTLARRADVRADWQPLFRDGYLGVLREAGQAIAEADPDPIQDCRQRLDELVAALDAEDATPLWPVYGSLLVNLRNTLDAMDEVAAAIPLRQPPLPFTRR